MPDSRTTNAENVPLAARIRTVIPEVFEAHLEELGFLWSQRRNALRSPDYRVRDLTELDARIEAHLQGLMAGGEAAVPLLEEGLTSDAPEAAFAAAYALLRMNTDSASERTLDAFLQAKVGAREGIRQALCHAGIDRLHDRLRAALTSAEPGVAVAAAEVLAVHGRREGINERLRALLRDDDPSVRGAAWRVVAIFDGGASFNSPNT